MSKYKRVRAAAEKAAAAMSGKSAASLAEEVRGAAAMDAVKRNEIAEEKREDKGDVTVTTVLPDVSEGGENVSVTEVPAQQESAGAAKLPDAAEMLRGAGDAAEAVMDGGAEVQDTAVEDIGQTEMGDNVAAQDVGQAVGEDVRGAADSAGGSETGGAADRGERIDLSTLTLDEDERRAVRSYALGDPDIRNEIIGRYLAEHRERSGSAPAVISGATALPVTPPRAPRSMKEAAVIARAMIKEQK